MAATSAISLLSRYCSTLYHDAFTKIMPMWIQEKVNKKNETLRLITIVMPISCPVKEAVKVSFILFNIVLIRTSDPLAALPP